MPGTSAMLQRKQSLFLLIGALLAFATWLFPIASFEGADGIHRLWTTGLFDPEGVENTLASPVLPFSVLHTILGAALVLSIFFYGNRKRQMRVVRGTYLLILAVVAFQYITRNSVLAYLAQDGAVQNWYGLSFYLPLVVLVLAFLAERAIKADDELVRSADRLR